MMRKTIIALAALATIGMTQMPTGALAAHSNGRSMGATPGGSVASHANTFRSSAGIHGDRIRNNFAVRNNVFVNNHDGFRHHHRFFRNRFAFSSFAFTGDDGCFVPRRVWTPWGWRWHRIWVCD